MDNIEVKTETGASAPTPLLPRPTKQPDRGSKILAQNVWRFIFVILIVIVGLVVGYYVGVSLIASAQTSDSHLTYIQNYHDIVLKPANAKANEVGFTLIGGLLGFLLGSALFTKIVGIGDSLKVMQASEKIALFVGALFGLLLTALIAQFTMKVFNPLSISLTTLILAFMVYCAITATMSMKDEFRFFQSASSEDHLESTTSNLKIFDTNVIIDGRISDVCRTGFVEGTIYIPGFVLDEIQHIADSADPLKRARGRRGLDILNQMRSELPLVVRTLDSKIDFTGVVEVDAKLVRMAKKLGGSLVTNDFNLNKVAELQGVPVLNINELANALKPVVLTGEEMRVTVIKEGKEQNQGVAYLDDGTMIVIEGGRRRIGETLEVVVSSVFQTVAGKMIFAQIREDYQEDEDIRNTAGSRPRRPLR